MSSKLCREEFEKNTLKRAEAVSEQYKKDWLLKKPSGSYVDEIIHGAWIAWQDCWNLHNGNFKARLKQADLLAFALKEIQACYDNCSGMGETDAYVHKLAKEALANHQANKEGEPFNVGDIVSVCGITGKIDRIDEKGFYWIGDYDFSPTSMLKANKEQTK